MNIGIIGCGWLGIRLADFFSKNHGVYTTTTSSTKQVILNERHYNAILIQFPEEGEMMDIPVWQALGQLDAIIVSVPISKKTEQYKLNNRFIHLIRFLDGYKKSLFLFSSIGIYPDLSEVISEDSLTESQLHPHIRGVENILQRAFPQITVLRLAGLMGDDRYLSKYTIPPSDVPVNHIHYEDICFILLRLIEEKRVSKLYNVVAPMHPGKQAVLSYQRGLIAADAEIPHTEGRIISTKKLQRELDYHYKHENPMFFTYIS